MALRSRIGAGIAGALVAFMVVWLWFRPGIAPVGKPDGESARLRADDLSQPATTVVGGEQESAAGLGASGGGIRDDLRILDVVFEQWATNFPRSGNPVGNNAEITAALTGANPLQLDLIPVDHPAINAKGELCDRWGTPFRFHQWSGTVMEIISAGPDRDFATADDVSSLDSGNAAP